MWWWYDGTMTEETEDITSLREQLATLRNKFERRDRALRDILKHMDSHGMQAWPVAKKARSALKD